MPSILDITLAAAQKDGQTVRPDGAPLTEGIHGVSVRPLAIHADARGSVMEILDPRWGWHPDPVVFAYCFTIRPGYAKGWNLHRLHEDRYCLLRGEMELVMFDPRPGSPSEGRVVRYVLSERQPCIVNVPADVWHADHNIGAADALVVNFPTMAYDHADPDKYRLPLDTPLIPHSFPGARGW